MPSSQPHDRLEDIMENMRFAESYIAGLSFEQFQETRMVRDAVERCLMRISEAAVKLGDVLDVRRPEVKWAQLRALGNVLRHAYDDVDARIVWKMIADDFPVLRAACEAEAHPPPSE